MSNTFVVGKFKCLMQPFYTLILIQMNVGNFSKQENKSSYSHQNKGNVLTRRVLHINVYGVEKSFSTIVKTEDC